MGPPEMSSLIIFSLMIITAVAGKSLLKGLIAGVLGLIVGTIGLDPMLGTRRFGFGLMELDEGIALMPMLIGLFAVSEFFINAEKKMTGEQTKLYEISKNPEDNEISGPEWKSCLKIIGLASAIGTILGAIPGIGPSIASFASYAQAKKFSKNPERFGKGAIEGVAAAEAGNNAVVGANLIPLLTLGIPGDIGAAILLGAFMIHGLHPGPLLFVEHTDVIYAIFMSLLLANVFAHVFASLYIKVASKIALVPKWYIFPTVLAFCFVGVYGFNQSIFDVWMAFVFGFIGYVLRKNGFPVAPLLIAFILAPILERAFRQSLLLSNGSLAVFLKSPISLFFLSLTLISIFFLIRSSLKQGARKPREE